MDELELRKHLIKEIQSIATYKLSTGKKIKMTSVPLEKVIEILTPVTADQLGKK